MRFIVRAYQIIAYYASFVLFAVLAFSLNVFSLLFGWIPGLSGKERFFQRMVHRAFAVFVGFVSRARIVPVRYVGFDQWPSRPVLVVANHPGLMDVGWVIARVPELSCIYKPDIGHSPLFSFTARRAGYLSSEHGRRLLRTAAAKLADGHSVLVFPEGTRTRQGDLNPLKPGFVVMARMAPAPIQLVRIICDSALLTKGPPWWRVPPLPATVTVTLGPCLPPPGTDTAAVVTEIEAWFHQGLAASARDARHASVHSGART
jgi:1-acyl-sn-glycerol-3-phosphate acyltransferase